MHPWSRRECVDRPGKDLKNPLGGPIESNLYPITMKYCSLYSTFKKMISYIKPLGHVLSYLFLNNAPTPGDNVSPRSHEFFRQTS